MERILSCNIWCYSEEAAEKNELMNAQVETEDTWLPAVIDLKYVAAVKSSGGGTEFLPDDRGVVYFRDGGRFTTDVPFEDLKMRWMGYLSNKK